MQCLCDTWQTCTPGCHRKGTVFFSSRAACFGQLVDKADKPPFCFRDCQPTSEDQAVEGAWGVVLQEAEPKLQGDSLLRLRAGLHLLFL